MDELSIRPAAPRDVEALSSLLENAFRHKFGFAFGVNPEEAVSLLHHMGRCGLIPLEPNWVAESSGQVVGMATLRLPGQVVARPSTTLWRLLRAQLSLRQALRAYAGLGILYLVFEVRTPHGQTAYLDNLAVREEMRGCGIGTRLLEYCFELARSAGCPEIALHVVDTNPRARRLYERMGFVKRVDRHLLRRAADLLARKCCRVARFRYACLMVRPLPPKSERTAV